MVSVSRRAGPPHFGAGRLARTPASAASGDSPVGLKSRILRQEDRQLLLRHRHRAAVVAVDDRDRRAPVALARDEPVAQPVVARSASPMPFAPRATRRSRRFAFLVSSPSNGPEFTMHAVTRRSVGLERRVLAPAAAITTRTGRSYCCRELEVALVVRGHRHDRARAVVHQDVVGDPDRDRLAVHRVDGVAPKYTPVFAASATLARRRSRRAACRTYSATSAASAVPRPAARTSGCSGASRTRR